MKGELESFNSFINIWLNIWKCSGCLLKVYKEQLSPYDQKRVFGVEKLNTAYQKKNTSLKSNLRLKK